MSPECALGIALSFWACLSGHASAAPETPAWPAGAGGVPAADEHTATPRRERSVVDVVGAALALLPRQPAYVSVIDVEAQNDLRVRDALRSLEAFTLPGKQGVYVTLCGPTLRRAIQTHDARTYSFDVHVLSAILWHEMAHLAGADERGAQQSEEKLWQRFIRDRQVDNQPGLQQMRLYASRRRHESTRR